MNKLKKNQIAKGSLAQSRQKKASITNTQDRGKSSNRDSHVSPHSSKMTLPNKQQSQRSN